MNVPETEAAPKSSASDSKLAVDYFNTAVTKESCQQATTNVVRVCGAEIKNSIVSHLSIKCSQTELLIYESWNFNSGNYLFTTDTK